MTRTELIAAIRKAKPDSEQWIEAVKALGRWKLNQLSNGTA